MTMYSCWCSPHHESTNLFFFSQNVSLDGAERSPGSCIAFVSARSYTRLLRNNRRFTERKSRVIEQWQRQYQRQKIHHRSYPPPSCKLNVYENVWIPWGFDLYCSYFKSFFALNCCIVCGNKSIKSIGKNSFC